MEREIDENLELRYILGECTPEEAESVEARAKSDPEYEKELLVMKNLHVAATMPEKRATDEQYQNFLRENSISRVKDEKKKRSSRLWLRYSVAAAVAALLALNIYYNWLGVKPQEPVVLLSELDDSLVNTLYTARGVKGKIVLPDGSVVFMNSDSEIRYPASFSGTTREVEFSGEGYFMVAKDSVRPMMVHCAKNFCIEVYGTEFNVRAYRDESVAKATLYSGSIRVVSEMRDSPVETNLVPNQTVTIRPDAIPLKELEKRPQTVKAWTEGKLVFDSTTLFNAAKMIERWHGVTVVFASDKSKGLPITATFTTESVSQIFELLRYSTGIDYEIDGNTVTVF